MQWAIRTTAISLVLRTSVAEKEAVLQEVLLHFIVGAALPLFAILEADRSFPPIFFPYDTAKCIYDRPLFARACM